MQANDAGRDQTFCFPLCRSRGRAFFTPTAALRRRPRMDRQKLLMHQVVLLWKLPRPLLAFVFVIIMTTIIIIFFSMAIIIIMIVVVVAVLHLTMSLTQMTTASTRRGVVERIAYRQPHSFHREPFFGPCHDGRTVKGPRLDR